MINVNEMQTLALHIYGKENKMVNGGHSIFDKDKSLIKKLCKCLLQAQDEW